MVCELRNKFVAWRAGAKCIPISLAAFFRFLDTVGRFRRQKTGLEIRLSPLISERVEMQTASDESFGSRQIVVRSVRRNARRSGAWQMDLSIFLIRGLVYCNQPALAKPKAGFTSPESNPCCSSANLVPCKNELRISVHTHE